MWSETVSMQMCYVIIEIYIVKSKRYLKQIYLTNKV